MVVTRDALGLPSREFAVLRHRGSLALCYGTRPQIIKASVLADVLAREAELVTIDTGQHYDYELNGLLYEQLGIQPPTHCLEVGSDHAAEQTATIVARSAGVLRSIRPRGVIVIGDTNSTLGCALAAAQLGLPVVHVEAGLRSNNPRMLEEVNRRVVDGLSALLCAPCQRAAETLRFERASGEIVVTGDVAYDALLRALPRIPSPPQGVPEIASLEGEPFVFATLHRAELVTCPQLLHGVLDALQDLHMPVLLAAHPRTALTLSETYERQAQRLAVHTVRPLGYLETIAAVRAAAVVVTDSGGVQREAYWLGTPCVTVRDETEWIETVEAGANVVISPAAARTALGSAVTAQLRSQSWFSTALGQGEAAHRVAECIDRVLG